MTTSHLIPALPDLPTARRAVEHAQSHESEPVANHSVRSYLFAVLLAEHQGLRAGADFDADLLFHACVLHDLGTSPSAPGQERFEVEGADMAADFLTAQGYGTRDVDLVWEAIALHTSPGIAERRGPLARLTRGGIAGDFGIGVDFVTDAQAEAVHLRHPRLNMASALVDDIVTHAARSPRNAPRFTIAGELVRERGERGGGPTTLEIATRASRWGE
ncbi:HD domain-containing protein [Streptomyces litchfieldiae]|uniref:HD domain-containing protein n=1 Tax=Streptomyces litchfieldiae TaxID=3075543 RepID=A0ABU2MT63_9ACTN|nr:HD domain-containing protein [Streptomyces sp. DSM 44938]MDT0344824.1 HD domain-containing protein [Streptomyces sp. DSM 44938]